MRLTAFFAIGAVLAALMTPFTIQSAASAATACVSADPQVGCGPYLSSKVAFSNGWNTYVNNDGWGCGPNGIDCGPQSITVYGPSNWSVTSRQAAGNTAVLTYPDVQQLVSDSAGNPVSLDSLAALYSTFAETMPHNSGTKAEAAYDIWMGYYDQEVMVWTDNVNQSLSYDTVLAHKTFFNVAYTLYRNGGPGSELIWARDSNKSAGTVHIRRMMAWLVAQQYVPESEATISDVEFGWEISSTGGVKETFKLSDYTLRAAFKP